MDKSFAVIFGGVFGLVGVIFLVVASFSLRSQLEFRKGAVSAKGTVVDLVLSSSKSGTYTPIFEFVDQDDHSHRVAGGVASNPPSFHRGEEVRVLYQPGKPERAQIDSFMESWFLTMVFGALGTVFTGIASGVAIYAVARASRARVAGVQRGSGAGAHGCRGARHRDKKERRQSLADSRAMAASVGP